MKVILTKVITATALVMALAATTIGADRSKDRDLQAGQNQSKKGTQAATAVKPATTETPVIVSPTQSTEPAKTAQPDATTVQAPASPNAGEQIKWQVISGGGVRGTSASYILTGTLGQTAAGPGTSASFKINQGFWQNFSSSCCVGVTGNVNATGSVDLADLSALVSYLTGGGYVLPCQPEANVNAVGTVDLADLSALVSYLTGGGYVLPACA